MRGPWNLRTARKRVAVTALIASLSASLAGASSALASSPIPPTPPVGTVYAALVDVHSGPGGAVSVTWSEFDSDPDRARAATLGANGWAWADPDAPRPPDPDIALPATAWWLRVAADTA